MEGGQLPTFFKVFFKFFLDGKLGIYSVFLFYFFKKSRAKIVISQVCGRYFQRVASQYARFRICTPSAQ